MKILFNEIAPKMHIFSATHIVLGVTCFFNIVAPEGGYKILIIKWGLKNIAVIGLLSEIHDPPF